MDQPVRLKGDFTANPRRYAAKGKPIYVRIGQRYFTFNDKITLPHRACCDRVLTSKAFREPDQDSLGRD